MKQDLVLQKNPQQTNETEWSGLKIIAFLKVKPSGLENLYERSGGELQLSGAVCEYLEPKLKA